MDAPRDNFLNACLFFNCNIFSRLLQKLAEKEFKDLPMSWAHATLLLHVYDSPGVSPKELSLCLHLNPSTITRFIDALEKKHLVIRQTSGKSAFIHPSPRGLAIKGDVAQAYKNLVTSYTSILGQEDAGNLSLLISAANENVKKALS